MAIAILGATSMGYIACELSASARRAVRQNFNILMEYADIRSITAAEVSMWKRAFGDYALGWSGGHLAKISPACVARHERV